VERPARRCERGLIKRLNGKSCCVSGTPCLWKEAVIPNKVHFIFGLREDFGGKPFSFVHHLAVKSAWDCNQPTQILFHYKHEPQGKWWEKSKPYLTLVPLEPPTHIFDRPLRHFAHQADVLRLEILMREGGIYLDMDVICLKSFAPLLKHSFVMGKQETRGLCNAVILAAQNAPFLRAWHEGYRSFRSSGRDNRWDEHSVLLPNALATEFPSDIHVEGPGSFFWPSYKSPDPLWKECSPESAFSEQEQLADDYQTLGNSFCIHLWETLWWKDHLKALRPKSIRSKADNFSKLCRRFVD